ncbi:LON peptidase N-terminal domain and RING finger protein 3-like [Petromyzon marinus]|uniref:LON peptidase N-terminal domain and RING finger protein 3-like n=1 Tax=Petromyzon marinus TaxID=7757 RepID=UPI003F713246
MATAPAGPASAPGSPSARDMLFLAAEASSAGNFEPAADKYGCELQRRFVPGSSPRPDDSGGGGCGDSNSSGNLQHRHHQQQPQPQHCPATQELLLRRADALAGDGRLRAALDDYAAALRLGRLQPGRLDALIDCLAQRLRPQRGLEAATGPAAGSESAAGSGSGVETTRSGSVSAFGAESGLDTGSQSSSAASVSGCRQEPHHMPGNASPTCCGYLSSWESGAGSGSGSGTCSGQGAAVRAQAGTGVAIGNAVGLDAGQCANTQPPVRTALRSSPEAPTEAHSETGSGSEPGAEAVPGKGGTGGTLECGTGPGYTRSGLGSGAVGHMEEMASSAATEQGIKLGTGQVPLSGQGPLLGPGHGAGQAVWPCHGAPGAGAAIGQSHGATSRAQLLQEPSGGCWDPLSCPLCRGLLVEPSTGPCGHSFCRRCLEREGPEACRVCGAELRHLDVAVWRVNVLLSALLQKLFPAESRAATLRYEGNALCGLKRLDEALATYTEALKLVPHDHLLLSNRAQVQVAKRSYEDALCDAELVCLLQPLWSKGYLRKGQALRGLGQMERALAAFLTCTALEPGLRAARTEAEKILWEVLAPNTESMCEGLRPPSPHSRSKETLFFPLAHNHWDPPFASARHINLCSEQDGESWTGQEEGAGCSARAGSLCSEGPAQAPVAAVNTAHVKAAPAERERVTESTARVPFKRKLGDVKDEITKRLKTEGGEPGADLQQGASTGRRWMVQANLIDASDLECSLCMRLFYEPVTTPCGHSFCRKCLERCLDHTPKCPLCKQTLAEYLAQRTFPQTVLLEDIISTCLPNELAERKSTHEQELAELANLNKDVPIFVCTMAFPTVPCPLHIFEPRYRLMVRRVVEAGTQQFGMCPADNVQGFAEYGCVLKIRSVEFFPDGRSVLDTEGLRRFRVLARKQKDGYSTADIEYLEDTKVDGAALTDLCSLHESVYSQASSWFSMLKENMRHQILQHFGPMPGKEPDPQLGPDGPSWCWWMLAVLPLDIRAQMSITSMTRLVERLVAIRRILILMTRTRAQ